MGNRNFGSARPEFEPGNHPFDTAEYALPTPSIQAGLEKVVSVIRNRRPGAMFTAMQRTGKTHAIMFWKAYIALELGMPIPIFIMSMHEFDRAGEAAFFELLLESVGHSLLNGISSVLRRRLNDFLCARAVSAKQRKVVLFIDEAQKLQEIHYAWLVDLTNDLSQRGIILTIFLVGQPELIHRRDAFILSKRLEYLGRFMAESFRLRGLRSEADVKSVLHGYDESEYPSGSSWTFTRFFFPTAFENGWRLSESAKEVWRAFAEVIEANGFEKDIPMDHFTLTVEQVLRSHSDLDTASPNLSLAIWLAAIRESGFRDAGRYRNDYKS